jgi:hypothetical protein
MAKRRPLTEAAKDPLAEKAGSMDQKKDEKPGIGHYAVTIAIGLFAGVIGGLLSRRFFRIF